MIKPTQIQLLLIALFILMPFASIAQKKQEETKHQRIESNSINLEMSEMFYDRMVDPEIYMADSNVVYFIKNNTKRWIISYDITNKKVGTKFKISNALKEAGTSSRDITTSFILNKNLVFITQDFSKKTNFLTFYYSIISTDGNVISAKKELTKLYCKKESNVSINLIKNKSDFELRAKIIIEDDEEEVINLIFGYDFQQKYQFKTNNKETLQEKNGEFYPPIFNFSDSIYLINIFAEDKKDKNLERIFHAFAYSKSGKMLFTQKLNTDNTYLNSFKVIKIGDEARLVAYYSESNSNNLDGSVSFVYSDSLNKFIVKENNKMPSNIRPSYVKFKSNKKGRAKGIFEFSEAKTTSNGTFYNINEQSYLSYETISTKEVTMAIEVYSTWTNLLLEKIDSTGKLIYTGIINTPDMNTYSVPKQTYHLMVQGNKVGVFFTSFNLAIPYYYRELITNYEKKKVRSIYLLKLENSTDRWWRQLKIPMEKGYSLDQLYVIPETNKAFVIFTKRRPAFVNFWKSLFLAKRKTKVGIANIRFE